MERVQLTDEEIEALAFRMDKEGHHLSAGTMRLVETLIEARVQVENEVRDILQDELNYQVASKQPVKKTPWWYFG